MQRKEQIREHVSAVLHSETFTSSPRLANLLSFCVNTALSGEHESLKETTIGINVFGREPGYDPKIDPIVRVNARRLRKKLDLFYDQPEMAHAVRILFRKGTYVPAFEVIQSAEIQHGSDVSGNTHVSPVLKMESLDHLPVDSRPGLLRPLTSVPGLKRDPALSPDKKTLAFIWDPHHKGLPHVYLQPVVGTQPIALTNAPYPEVRFVWSTDGKAIALLRMKQPSIYELVVVSIASREERVPHTFRFTNTLDRPALDWSPDGRWFLHNEQAGTKPAHLVMVSALDGESRQVTDPPEGSTGDIEARFAPNSKEIAFRRGHLGELYFASVENQERHDPVKLTFTNPGVRGISWSPDSSAIYFGSTYGGREPAIWRYARATKKLKMVSPDGFAAISPAVARDGQELVFATSFPRMTFWMFERNHGITKPFESIRGLQTTPSISPDGKTLVYTSDTTGSMELWTVEINNPTPRSLTEFNGSGRPLFPSWSADGKKIAYFYRERGLNYAYEIPATGGVKPTLLRGGDDYTLCPQYSTDGCSLYFLSNLGGKFRVWRMSLVNRNERPQQITMCDTRYFRVSEDGQGLYYSSRKGVAMSLIYHNLRNHTEISVWDWQYHPVGFAGWDIKEHQLYYVGFDGVSLSAHLFSIDLKARIVHDLGRISVGDWLGASSLSVGPNGDSVWVSNIDSDDGDVMSLRLADSPLGGTEHPLLIAS